MTLIFSKTSDKPPEFSVSAVPVVKWELLSSIVLLSTLKPVGVVGLVAQY